jgi:hypothetical protein
MPAIAIIVIVAIVIMVTAIIIVVLAVIRVIPVPSPVWIVVIVVEDVWIVPGTVAIATVTTKATITERTVANTEAPGIVAPRVIAPAKIYKRPTIPAVPTIPATPGPIVIITIGVNGCTREVIRIVVVKVYVGWVVVIDGSSRAVETPDTGRIFVGIIIVLVIGIVVIVTFGYVARLVVVINILSGGRACWGGGFIIEIILPIHGGLECWQQQGERHPKQ